MTEADNMDRYIKPTAINVDFALDNGMLWYGEVMFGVNGAKVIKYFLCERLNNTLRYKRRRERFSVYVQNIDDAKWLDDIAAEEIIYGHPRWIISKNPPQPVFIESWPSIASPTQPT